MTNFLRVYHYLQKYDIPKTIINGYTQIAFQDKKMKVLSFPQLLVVTIIGCLLLAIVPKSFAAPTEDNPGDVLAAAKTWLSLIDAGKYDESYTIGCTAFHDKITQDRWVLTLKTLRAPLGNVISRKVTDHVYKPNGVPGLDGPCVVISYETSFDKAEGSLETVILKWENGKWLGAGYTFGPKPSDTTPESPTDTTTTTTQEHVKPPAPSPAPPPGQPLPQ